MNIKALAIEPMRKIPKSKSKKVLVAACSGGDGGDPSKIFKSQEMLAAINRKPAQEYCYSIDLIKKIIK